MEADSDNGKTRRACLFGAGAAGLALLSGGCSPAPDLAAGESGRVARISDGDLLVLDGGLRVRLAEVEAPAPGYDGRPDAPFAVEARQLLTAAALGRQARLWYGGLSRDRYDRAVAHVIAQDELGRDLWLNGLMARQGGARVRSWPDNCRRVRQLYAFEEEARADRRGLWALDAYRIRAPDDLGDPSAFMILEAALLEVIDTPGEAEARLAPGGVQLYAGVRLGPPDSVLDLRLGMHVRVRGRLDTRGEVPRIAISHWAQVEMAA